VATDETPPLCACGCGETVGSKRGKWNKYVNLHAQRQRSKESLEKAMEVRRRGSIPIEKFHAEVERLKQKNNWHVTDIMRIMDVGKGNYSSMFHNKQRLSITRGSYQKYMERLRAADGVPIDRDLIPIEAFRKQIFAIKERRGLRWVDIAEICGHKHGYFQAMMYDSKKKNVTKHVARHVLMRLAGKATPPTTYEIEKLSNRRKWEGELQRF